MLKYFMKHLTLAMVFIFIAGLFGILTNDPSPHPAGMFITGGVYLTAYITFTIVRSY